MTLPQQLSVLESSGLIRLAQTQPELEYLFKHALMQDVVYASILKADRRHFHHLVGEILETAYPERLEEIAPVLGQHFDAAENTSQAIKYYTLAGDAATRAYANTEAAQHYTRATQLVNLTSHPPVSTLQHLYTQLGHVLELDGKYAAALHVYRDLEVLAQQLANKKLTLTALMAQAKVLATPHAAHNPAEAKIVLARATELANDLGEREIAARSLWNLMLLYIFGGEDLRPALEYGQRSIALAREFNLREQLAFSLNDIFYIYFSLGQGDEGLKAITEARDLWQAFGNRPMLANALTIMGEAYLERGDFPQALALANEARTITQAINNIYGEVTTLHASAMTHYLIGNWAIAFAEMNASFPKAQQVGHAISLTLLRCELAYMYGLAGQMDQAFELTKRAAEFSETAFTIWHSHPYTIEARLYALQGDAASAAQALTQAQQLFKPFTLQIFNQIALGYAEVEVALCQKQYAAASQRVALLVEELTTTQREGFLTHALWLQGRAFALAHNAPAAIETLQHALRLSEQNGEQLLRWQILALLAQLQPEQNQLASARASLKIFLSNLPKELYDSFVVQPDIASLLNTPTLRLRSGQA